VHNVLIKRIEKASNHFCIQGRFLGSLLWFHSFVGYLIVLPTLWEAIALEGTSDRLLCFAVMWQGLSQLLAIAITTIQLKNNSRTISWAGILRGVIVLLVVTLFCGAHVDDPLRLAYASLLLILSLGVRPCYGSGFLREPLLTTLFGLSLLFALGVVRHEWWYCELKGETCAAISATHIVVVFALVVLLLFLFGGREKSLCVKSVRRCSGALLLCVALSFLLSDKSMNPTLKVTFVDSSVGFLSTILVLITPYLNGLSVGALNGSSKPSSLRSLTGFGICAIVPLGILAPTLIQFYRTPHLEHSLSGERGATFELGDELVPLLLTAEDPTFFFHSGVDYVRLRDAVSELLQSGKYGRGGSTLSMQLGKVLFLEYDKTIIRKLRQLLLGILIELTYSKETILRKYLQVVPFAPGVVGIESASQKFFGVAMSQLTRDHLLRLVVAIFDPTLKLNGEEPFKGNVSIRARTIETREKVFRRTIVGQLHNLRIKPNNT